MTEREMTLVETAARVIDPGAWKTGPHTMTVNPATRPEARQQRAMEIARAALRALGYPPEALDQPASAWAVVPVVPTQAMLDAWTRHQTDRCMLKPSPAENPGIGYYRAMIKAARPGAARDE